jgi:hypothetical protein
MKKKKIKLGMFKYLFILPLLLLAYCQNNDDAFIINSEKMLTKDSKVISLMKSAVTSDSDPTLSKSDNESKNENDDSDHDDNDDSDHHDDDDSDQCTQFLYPMTFFVLVGDDPALQTIVINSDEELLIFFDTLTTTNQLYISFPVTLLDADGVETVINDLAELEGTLQMAVDACSGYDDDDNHASDDSDHDESDDNDHNGSDDSNHNGNSDSDDDSTDDYEYCQDNNKKVYICHKGITICVSVNAIWGHMQHHEEDYLGSCED